MLSAVSGRAASPANGKSSSRRVGSAAARRTTSATAIVAAAITAANGRRLAAETVGAAHRRSTPRIACSPTWAAVSARRGSSGRTGRWTSGAPRAVASRASARSEAGAAAGSRRARISSRAAGRGASSVCSARACATPRSVSGSTQATCEASRSVCRPCSCCSVPQSMTTSAWCRSRRRISSSRASRAGLAGESWPGAAATMRRSKWPDPFGGPELAGEVGIAHEQLCGLGQRPGRLDAGAGGQAAARSAGVGERARARAPRPRRRSVR